ncbi:Plant UBX domain-containing protein 8 [Carex littledalei]|uniref:Plant UBX domain-containing protein 8 n=1 Tax=Carex littledalei TaxID=544730 RepID=A0A833QTG8_9POAL|nr:Plant UBX domain-containing protein 8 [Carex littledalei]
MDTPTPEQIETFVGITGASGAIAAQKLQEHHGDLNAAVNAYFNEGDRTNNTNQRSQPLPDESEMEIDDPVDVPIPRSTFLSAHEEINPFSILNNFPGFRNPMMGPTAHDFFARDSRVSQPRVSREIPIEVKDDNSHVQVGPSNTGPAIEEVTGNDLPPHYGPEIHPTVIVDENDDVVNVDGGNNSGRLHHVDPSPSAPIVADVTDYNNDIEEQMIQAAIEASRRDAMGHSEEAFDRPAGDSEIARAVSLSVQAAEQEGALHAQGVALGNNSPDLPEREIRNARRVIDPNGRLPTQKVGPSSSVGQENESDQEETEEVEEVPLVRHRYPTRGASRNVQYVEDLDSPPYSPPPQNARAGRRQIDGHDFPSDEWGGLSNMEHDEAMMLEAAMFGGIPDGAAYRFSYPQFGPGGNNGYPVVAPRAPSPGLTEQRLLREQQDDDYLAALQADREKELKAIQEREAELQRQKLLEEESRRKQLEEEELERKLAAKEASLPQEPSPEDEGAITLLVRMPDGSRHGRRFLKSDKLQTLFDFIDVARTVKPGTYRLVRTYPRRAFTDGETELSFNDLGLTTKQEALFLETI